MAGHCTKEALTNGCGHNRINIELAEARSTHSGRLDAVRWAGVWSHCFPTVPNSRRQGRAMWAAL
jgi:hypothetical protein